MALTGDLKLTVMMHGVHLTSRLPGWGYRYGTIPRTYSGILDLKMHDADYVLRHGEVAISKFEMPNGDKGQLVEDGAKITVRREDLLVTHDQREHVERNILKLHEPDPQPVPAPFEYSWDYRRVELGGETFSLGPKQTRIVGCCTARTGKGIHGAPAVSSSTMPDRRLTGCAICSSRS